MKHKMMDVGNSPILGPRALTELHACPGCAGAFQLVELAEAGTALAHTLPGCETFAKLAAGAFVERAAAGLQGPGMANWLGDAQPVPDCDCEPIH